MQVVPVHVPAGDGSDLSLVPSLFSSSSMVIDCIRNWPVAVAVNVTGEPSITEAGLWLVVTVARSHEKMSVDGGLVHCASPLMKQHVCVTEETVTSSPMLSAEHCFHSPAYDT